MKKIKKIVRREGRNRYAGYSFIEGVVATFIVTAGMLAVIQLMTASLTVLLNSRDQTMATFLAQEGVEIIRNIRDNNWAAGRDTFDLSKFPATDRNNCRVDIYSDQVKESVDCNNGANSKTLQKNSSTGIYLYSSSFPDSKFKRKIMISYDTGNQNTASAATVTGMVTWGGSDLPSTLSECTAFNRCVFATVILNKWGGTD